MSTRLNTDAELFIQKYYAHENPLYQKIRAVAVENHCDHMIVAPSEARTLKFLIELTQAQKIVEIGCLYGLTCMRMAEALPSNGRIWTLEKNSDNAKIAQEFLAQSPDASKIQLVVGDAIQVLPTLEANGPFDCVFIDADKAAYPKYLDWAYRNLKRSGLVICDNTFMGGGVWGSPEEQSKKSNHAMLEVHKELSQSKRWIAHTLPSFDGLTVALKV